MQNTCTTQSSNPWYERFMQFDGFVVSETGPVREHNEDSWLMDVDEGLFVVADGMGGHAAGEVASRLAVEAVRDVMLEGEDPDETRLLMDVMDPTDFLRERLRYAMNQASLRIRREVEVNPSYAGMGTTLVVLLIEDDTAHLAHVGDSRAYLYRDGRIQLLTRDHTLVQQEVDAGRLTPELARVVPHKNILTRSVGYHGSVEPDVSSRTLESGDVLILCSDGMTDSLDDSRIEEICGETHPEELSQKLADCAIAEGSTDNVTVAIVRLG